MDKQRQIELCGRNMVAFRHAAGLSQQELAERLETSQQSIHRYESGRYIPPTEVLLKMGEIFGRTLDHFFSENPPPPKAVAPLFVRYKIVGKLDADLQAEIDAAASRINREQADRVARLVREGRKGKKL